mgnify:CR=1 FL=1
MNKFTHLAFILCISVIFLSSCGIGKKIKDFHDPVDLRNTPLDPDERAKRNIEEGRGISLGKIGNNKTTYEFSTSNPMWRASLEILDFLPLTTVDYSGGMIITDWYTEDSSKDSIKISVRFLANEIKTENLKIIVHKKTCSIDNACKINILKNSKINEELLTAILKKAAVLEKNSKSKN